MKVQLAPRLLLAIALGASTCQAAAASATTPSHTPDREISTVHIELESFGLGGRSTESFDLTPAGAGFLLRDVRTEDAPLSGKPKRRSSFKPVLVDASHVRTLAAALRAPLVSRSEGIDRLTSPQWLEAHAAESYDGLATGHGCSPEARQLFIARYKDKTAAVQAANAYYDTQWTDDYPSAKVSVTYADGTTATVQSFSQLALGLPWKIAEESSWNPAIANAIVGLLPKTSHLGSRYTSRDLVPGIARAVLEPIEAQWEDLEGRCLYQSQIAKLTPHFDVTKVFRTGPEVLSATLRSDDMPRNLVIDVRLPGGLSRASQAALDRFLKLAPTYIEVARPFVTANPSIDFELWYAEGRSFNFKDDEVYGDDQAVEFLRKQAGRDDGVHLRQRGIARGREWVVLPDGKWVLWKEAR